MNDRQLLRSVTEDRRDAALRELEDRERAAIPFAVYCCRPPDRPGHRRKRAHQHLGGELGPPIVGDRGGVAILVDWVAVRCRTAGRERGDEGKAAWAAVAG